MTAAVGGLEAPGPRPREVWLTFGMSVLLHGLLVGGIVLIPHFRVGTYITVPVSYTVSLVSAAPGGRASGGSVQPAPPAPPAPAPAPATAPAQRAPAVRPAPAPRPAEELTLPGRQVERKPTKAPEPSLRPPAVTGPETTRPVPPTPVLPPPTAPAAPVAPPAPSVASVGSGAAAGNGKTSGVELAGEGTGAGGGTALAAYLSLVDWKIQSNWVPVAAAGAPEVVVVVRFRVLRSGQVRDVELDASSGNGSVDTSALRAIRQSVPLPPFPILLTEPYLDLRYRFVVERG